MSGVRAGGGEHSDGEESVGEQSECGHVRGGGAEPGGAAVVVWVPGDGLQYRNWDAAAAQGQSGDAAVREAAIQCHIGVPTALIRA